MTEKTKKMVVAVLRKRILEVFHNDKTLKWVKEMALEELSSALQEVMAMEIIEKEV